MTLQPPFSTSRTTIAPIPTLVLCRNNRESHVVSADAREPEARAQPLAAEPLKNRESHVVSADAREPEARAQPLAAEPLKKRQSLKPSPSRWNNRWKLSRKRPLFLKLKPAPPPFTRLTETRLAETRLAERSQGAAAPTCTAPGATNCRSTGKTSNARRGDTNAAGANSRSSLKYRIRSFVDRPQRLTGQTRQLGKNSLERHLRCKHSRGPLGRSFGFAQDFGSRLRRLLSASTPRRSATNTTELSRRSAQDDRLSKTQADSP